MPKVPNSLTESKNWGGKRLGAGRRPDLTESDERYVAMTIIIFSYYVEGGKGKRSYGLRRALIELARADCEENGVKASHNAVEKAWRKYRKNVEFSRICEIRAKQVLGMFHDMSADASSNKQLEYVINLARKFGQNEV